MLTLLRYFRACANVSGICQWYMQPKATLSLQLSQSSKAPVPLARVAVPVNSPKQNAACGHTCVCPSSVPFSQAAKNLRPQYISCSHYSSHAQDWITCPQRDHSRIPPPSNPYLCLPRSRLRCLCLRPSKSRPVPLAPFPPSHLDLTPPSPRSLPAPDPPPV